MAQATLLADLAERLKDQGFDHVRGAPLHPQRKFARWKRSDRLVKIAGLFGSDSPWTPRNGRWRPICSKGRRIIPAGNGSGLLAFNVEVLPGP